MTNREVLEAIADEIFEDFLVLTYEEILDEYVGDVGIDTVEDFCGYDMDEDEIAYWVMDQDPLFRFSKADEDISDDDANDFLMYWDIDDEFPALREQYEEAARTGMDHREIAVIQLVGEMEDDFSELEDYLRTHEEDYPNGDLYEFAFREAVRQGNAGYVDEHAEDFDLNDSSYIADAANEEIVDILLENGACEPEKE